MNLCNDSWALPVNLTHIYNQNKDLTYHVVVFYVNE